MKPTKRFLWVSVILPLFVGAGCATTHESIGHNEPVDAGSGGSTAATTIVAVGGATNDGNAFGKVGADPTNTTYTRPMSLSPRTTTDHCDTVSLTGTLDGQMVDQLYERKNLTEGATGNGILLEWSLETWFGTSGSAAVAGGTSDTGNPRTIGTVLLAQTSEVVLPMDLARAKSFLCVKGASSLERAANQAILRFPNVGFLADCDSGAAVSGTIELCEGSGCPQEVLGDIDGSFYDATSTSYKLNGQTIQVRTEALDLRTTFVATSASTATLKHSWLVDTTSGAVYCAGTTSYAEASLVVDAAGHRSFMRRYHFLDLRGVGSCAQASGTDALEIRVCTSAI